MVSPKQPKQSNENIIYLDQMGFKSIDGGIIWYRQNTVMWYIKIEWKIKNDRAISKCAEKSIEYKFNMNW